MVNALALIALLFSLQDRTTELGLHWMLAFGDLVSVGHLLTQVVTHNDYKYKQA